MTSQIADHPILRLFNELLAVPSPSGREERMAALIRAKLRGWSYEPQTDAAGNVFVRLAGREPDAPLCCIAAHIDEIGALVTALEPDGALRVDRSGQLAPWKLGEGPVEIVGDHATIVGVVAIDAGSSGAVDPTIGWHNVRVLTGLSPAELAAAGIRPGSTAVPTRDRRGPTLFGPADDPLVGAWTFDNRISVAIVLRLLETMRRNGLQPYHPTIVAFTVHEEGGGHGAKALAHAERPETFIAIDGCPLLPGRGLQLDERPGIWSHDRLAHYDQRLITTLRQAARAAGTDLQPLVYDGAATDASFVYSVGGAPRVACFGHLRANRHGYEVARAASFENVLNTLAQFVETWQGDEPDNRAGAA